MGNRLKNKVAIITGAARGQGLAEAELFAAEGAKVIVTDVLDDKGIKAVDKIKENGGDAIYIHLDVTRQNDWAEAVKTAKEVYGKIDILVNNAGVAISAEINDTTEEIWTKIVQVNQTGAFYGIQSVVPIMKENRAGSIVNISSIAGFVGSRVGIAYGASKGAIRSMTKSAALELASFGIRVNTIIPGAIDTDMAKGLNVSSITCPLGRFGKSPDIAYGALYLASDESSYVTGIDLVIDGGYTAGGTRS